MRIYRPPRGTPRLDNRRRRARHENDRCRTIKAKTEARAGMPDEMVSIDRVPLTEEIRAARIGEPTLLNSPICLVEYDPAWPGLFQREADRIRRMLGVGALLIEHTGSTSVPGLAAKPIVDILLVVADSADEAAYVPPMEAAGYVLRICEPDWYQHRLFKGPDTDVNLHVFSEGCEEIERILLFRDRLRDNATDRALYERIKRELARRVWKYTQNYADAKTVVVETIIARARAARDEQ
jgi:GrpB-like predicted nucleotidyltransferase (UPF0157 family)